MRTIATIIFILTLTAQTLASTTTTTITLRTTVVANPDQTITLADIALLTGPEATRLAGTPIDTATLKPDPAGWRGIDTTTVRQWVDAHTQHNTNWGAIELRGGPCFLRYRPTTTPTTQAHQPEQAQAQPTPATPGTVREMAEAWIARAFNAAPADTEIRWLSAADGLLDHPTAGRLPHIADAGRSDRMALRITLYNADASVAVEGEARAEVRIRRPVAVLTRDVPRRRALSADDFREERQWLDATTNPANPASVLGREAATTLRAGAVVTEADIHASPAVKRGDRVQVRIITPTITATLLARAMADGRPGQTIAFESIAPSRSDRLRFDARVESAGAAVAIAGNLNR